jgi:hypothetical protein
MSGWGAVPTTLQDDERLTLHDVATLLALSSWFGETVWPSQATIAKRAKISVDSVGRALKHLRELGLVEWENRYRENGGKTSNAYRLTFSWDEAPTPQPSVGDTADSGVGYRQERDEVSKSEVPKKKRTPSAAADDAFEEFYRVYPRHTGRGQAVINWRAAIKKVQPETIIEAATQYASQVNGTEARFIPHPGTWLSGERWADEPVSTPADRGWWE